MPEFYVRILISYKMYRGNSMLRRIYDVLTDNNLDWFLDSGSLLGMVRDGAFLPWDGGIDISVLLRDGDIERVKHAVAEIMSFGFYATKYTWGGYNHSLCSDYKIR